jgi:DNA repair protein RadA
LKRSSSKSREDLVPEHQEAPAGLIKTGIELSQEQQRRERISTSSKNLDDLLSGGLETGEITQFYGESNTGKTHLCHLLCVVLPPPYQAIYIDTGGTFREERIKSIAKARGLDGPKILSNITVKQPTDSEQQESFIEDARSLVKSNSKIKLLIIDSMMFHYNAEYSGRSGLPERAQRLNIILNMLYKLARKYNIVVVFTNQSTSNLHRSESKYPKPFGGDIISSISSYIAMLKCINRLTSDIVVRLFKSPVRGYETCYLKIVESGFLDENPHYIFTASD